LVKNFAAQAVIAIENARLLNELRQRTDDLSESLEQQTATSEVLQVISSSPTDMQPVFDTIAVNALNLCGATFSIVLRFDGEMIELASMHNLSDLEGIDALRRVFPRVPREGGATDRAILTRSIAYIPDCARIGNISTTRLLKRQAIEASCPCRCSAKGGLLEQSLSQVHLPELSANGNRTYSRPSPTKR
jgi:hypothetical protein